MNQPDVSVVLAVRDDPDGLEAAAGSVLSQREVHLELVVVDDGSTDATGECLDRLCRRDGRVRPLAGDGTGLTRALVAGCRAARAPVIARQDAGDVSLPGRLRRELDLLGAEPSLVLVSCCTEAVGPAGEPLFLARGGRESAAPYELRPEADPGSEVSGPAWHGSVVFRRSAYEAAGGYRPEFRMAQDWDLWWRLAERGPFANLPEPLYRCTLAPGSLSLAHGPLQRRFAAHAREAAMARKEGRSETEILRRAQYLSQRADRRRLRPGRAALARGNYFLGATLLARGDSRGRAYLWRAVAANPLHLKAWIRWLQSAARR